MQFTAKLNSFLLLISAALTTAAPPTSAIGATYFITNIDGQENHVVVHSVLSDGTVKYSNTISTGGLGRSYQNMTVPAGSLNSQGSVVVDGQYLFVVNAGSDSISMFKINSHDPTKIHRLGNPVYSGGDFPVSIAVSSQSGEVCVLNAGAKNGVQCFSLTASGLHPINNSNRLLNLPEDKIPVFSPSVYSVSQVLFSPDGSKLVASVKGEPTTGAPGFLAAWDVFDDGSLSRNHSVYFPPTKEGQNNYGFTYLFGSEGYVVSDTVKGGLIYDFSKGYDPKNVVSKELAIPHNLDSCWLVYSAKTETYFFTDFGTDFLYEYAIDPSNLNATSVATHVLEQGLFAIDSTIGVFGPKQYLYQLTSVGRSIVVLDIETNGQSKIIQSYNFTQPLIDHGFQSTPSVQGMAVYVKN